MIKHMIIQRILYVAWMVNGYIVFVQIHSGTTFDFIMVISIRELIPTTIVWPLVKISIQGLVGWVYHAYLFFMVLN